MANEKRLIDANALQLEPDPWGGMNGVICLGRSGGKTMATVQAALKRMIDNAPTVDAVEVVRCKDCKHGIWDEDEQMWECILGVDLTGDADTYSMFHEYNHGDHFCSYGERRTDV